MLDVAIRGCTSEAPTLGGPGEGALGDGGYVPGGTVIEHGDLSGKGGTMHDATQIELDSTGFTNTTADNVQDGMADLDAAISGGGAPTTVDYLVGTASAGLSAEIVVGTTPGGELGGTWASPTVDTTHSGSAHADFIAKSLLTTQDDIIVRDATGPARLAKGSDGQVLTVDPTTHHLAWATPSGGGGGSLTVEEVDGSPTDSAVTKLIFPNGTLSISSHEATYTPAGGGGGGGSTEEWWRDDNAPGGTDDREFTEGTTIGTLTRVSSGTVKGTWAETRGGLEWTHTVTGGTELDVYALARTCSVGDYITVAARYPGYLPNYIGVALGFADGTTFGTSKAMGGTIHLTGATYRHMLNSWPGFNSRGADGTIFDIGAAGMVFGWRVKYEAANTWGLYIRSPGTSVWRKVQSNYSYTMTPTHVYFGVMMLLGPGYSADNGAGVRLECMRIND
jgi:hypothetical protein